MTNSRKIKSTALLSFVFLLITFFSLAQSPVTVEQLNREFHDNLATFKEKYEGKTLLVTGKIKSVTVAFGEVYVLLTPDGYNTPVEFIFPDEEQNRKLSKGSTITAEGTLSRIFAGALGKAQFKPSKLLKTVAAGNQQETSTSDASAITAAPADLPMGEYNVQGQNFNFMYKLTFSSNGTYRQFDKIGKYKYNRATKLLELTSGPLEGFKGLYYTKGRNNDKGQAMIAIDYNGNVPNISNSYNGQYLYAIFQHP